MWEVTVKLINICSWDRNSDKPKFFSNLSGGEGTNFLIEVENILTLT